MRVSGTEEAVRHALAAIGGDPADFGIWDDLRHGRLPAFLANRLWRLSVPRTAQVADLGGMRLTDWAGAQLWLATDAPAQRVRAAARSAGGHATLFHAGVDGEDVFEPLPAPLLKLHRRVKVALDPFGLFNRGRMYPEF